ncbi:MAG TPA: hypothetical protein VE981_03330 [Planctomycetota bacterium]|nr:hypothetical protein [Planctomycetota bacterium]
MRVPVLFCVSLVVALVSCKSRHPVAVDSRETADLPRDSAVQKLGELLPTVDYVYCTAPKWSLKASEISKWNILSEGIFFDHGKGNVLRLSYADITDVRVEASSRYFSVKVYSVVQTDASKDHFQFLFKAEDRAKQVAELLLSLKKK